MKIKSLSIKNFKSIVDLTINEPNAFSVFVGPNGSGKSNIFEALELIYLSPFQNVQDLFGGFENLKNRNKLTQDLECSLEFNIKGIPQNYSLHIESDNEDIIFFEGIGPLNVELSNEGVDLIDKFNKYYSKNLFEYHRLFVGNSKSEKLKVNSNRYLSTSSNNLEKVLQRLLENDEKKEEISDWLSLFIPEFDRIEVQKSQFSSNEDLLIYQKHYDRPFNKELISDGTYNIIALLTAVYQSDEPQFLCIEEPENGLHPKVIKQLVNFFRSACEEKGHYIWLNTRSQTLVSQLNPEEIILVDKVEGETKISQLKGFNTHGLEMDEAWLSNALGGGLPW
jgi:predicted ATPase